MLLKRPVLAVIVLSVMVITPLGFSNPQGANQGTKSANQDAQDKASIWMRGKLACSKNILEGLTKENFPLMRENAETMLVLDYLESWFRSDVEGYKDQMRAFRLANEDLVNAAREKNLDGATLAYTQLTISCVRCHKIVRSVKK